MCSATSAEVGERLSERRRRSVARSTSKHSLSHALGHVRGPARVAQVPLQLSVDRRHGVARKRSAAAMVEALDGLHEAHARDLHQVVGRLAAPAVAQREPAGHRQEARRRAPRARRRRPRRCARTAAIRRPGRSPVRSSGALGATRPRSRSPGAPARVSHQPSCCCENTGSARARLPLTKPVARTCVLSVLAGNSVVRSPPQGTQGERESHDAKRGEGAGRRRIPCGATALAAFVLVLLAAAPALGAFPGTNPGESVRINTPNDPEFDHCEPDDEQIADLHQRLRPADRALRVRAERVAADRALPQPHRPPHAAPVGPEHARRPQPARPGLGRLGRPGLEVLDRRPERAGRDPRHRHPLGQGLAAQEGRAQPRRAAAAPQSARARAPSTTATRTARSTSTTTRATRASRPRPATMTSRAPTRSSTAAT